MSKSYGPLVDRLLVTKWKRIWKRNKIQVYHNSSTEKNVPSWICCYFFNWRPHVLVFSIELSQPLGRKLKQMNECNATVVAGFVIWGMLRIFRNLDPVLTAKGLKGQKKALCSLMPSTGGRCNYAEPSGFRFRWRRAQYGISQKNILDVKAVWMNAGGENNETKKANDGRRRR